MSKGPKTLDEAINIAIEEERNEALSSRHAYVSTLVEDNDSDLTKVMQQCCLNTVQQVATLTQEVKEAVNRMTQERNWNGQRAIQQMNRRAWAPPEVTRYKPNRSCFNCGSLNHIIRDCRLPRQTFPRNQRNVGKKNNP